VIFCVRYNGLVNAKAVGISAGPDNKGFVLTTKRSKVNKKLIIYVNLFLVLRIRIRIHMFLGLLDPDPLVRGMDPDPSIIKQKSQGKP
jgi:hypothetical protein